MVICHGCKQLLSLTDQVLEFDLNGIKATLCESCYKKLPKEKKKKLVYTGKKESILAPALGFAVAGGVGLLVGASYSLGKKHTTEKEMKQQSIDRQKLDNYTIDKFNCHFFLCSPKQQREALNKAK